jgi:hypothetical protein
MMLRTWAEIQAALQRYPTRSQESDVTTFGWPMAGRTTEIFQVKFAELQGRGRIFIGVNVRPDVPALAHDALTMNSELLFGALVAFKGNIVLKHMMTVGSFDEAELDDVIASMARTAEQARGRLSKPQQTTNLGVAYSD